MFHFLFGNFECGLNRKYIEYVIWNNLFSSEYFVGNQVALQNKKNEEFLEKNPFYYSHIFWPDFD